MESTDKILIKEFLLPYYIRFVASICIRQIPITSVKATKTLYQIYCKFLLVF